MEELLYSEEEVYQFGYEVGLKAGKEDGWMDIENTIEETIEDYSEDCETAMDLVAYDFDLWRETEHYQIYYLKSFNKKMDEEGIEGEDLIDYMYGFEEGFLEGYLTGRKEIGIDIMDKASKLVNRIKEE